MMRSFSFLRKEWKEFVGLAFLDRISQSSNSLYQTQKLEIQETNLPLLLRYEDKNSMWHSIETRLPFLDYQLVQKCLSMDVNLKIRQGWTKYVLRKSMSDLLPDDVIWRRDKLGFNAPEQTWLSEHSAVMKDEIAKSPLLASVCDIEKLLNKYERLDNKLKWRLVNLAVWGRVYNVRFD